MVNIHGLGAVVAAFEGLGYYGAAVHVDYCNAYLAVHSAHADGG